MFEDHHAVDFFKNFFPKLTVYFMDGGLDFKAMEGEHDRVPLMGCVFNWDAESKFLAKTPTNFKTAHDIY